MKQELVESPEVVKTKAEQLARLIERSKHFICFTGAGISTSVGIPDYRSAQGTILKTGAGAYEKSKEEAKKELPKIRKIVQSVSTSFIY